MTVEEIFLVAVGKPPGERAAYLDAACAGGPELRAQVEGLIRSHEAAGSLLEKPLFQTAPTADHAPPAEGPGAVVGPYKLIEPIGEGGMGSVWMAQQTEPVRRLVAVKLIKAGMDTRQVVARFEAERQALALMDHPNIARVLDGGTTGAGRPYFVMDLVKGVPITRYCDGQRLTLRQRLELFVPVCQAVQHAHQKGIIHRDIKPSNVLVALYDGRPVPKVIDFGVAKAAGQSLTDKTLVTGFGAIVGTLEYMSPEQAEINQLDIDTRSDIYSLGVLLYELLAGSTPFSKKDLEKAGMLEMLRVIREKEPSKPSTKLSSSDALPTLSANRGTEPGKLTRLVRGELDWIVMKALEKDRTRRYETANGFAADVQRYLADEPVQAGPPSAAYRLRKFVRRNRGPVLGASLVLLAVIGGIFGTTIGLIRADDARERAETSAERERLAKQQAERRLAQIEKGVELFAGLVQGLKPQDEEKGTPPLYEQLRQRAVRAADDLVDDAVGDPLVVARLQTLLGTTLLGLGEPSKAVELLERARATRQARLGPDHADTHTALANLAKAYLVADKLPQAIALYEQVRDAQVKTLGADHPKTVHTLNNLARALADQGIKLLGQKKWTEAEGALRKVVEIRRKTAPNEWWTYFAMSLLGYAHLGKKEYSDAEPLLLQAYEGMKALEAKNSQSDSRYRTKTLLELVHLYEAWGKPAEAAKWRKQLKNAKDKP